MNDIQKFLDDQLNQIKQNLGAVVDNATKAANNAVNNAAAAVNGLPQTQSDISKIAAVTTWIKTNLVYVIAGAGLLVVGVIFIIKKKK